MLKKELNGTTVCKGTYEELKDYFISIQKDNYVIDWSIAGSIDAYVSDRNGDAYIYPVGNTFNFSGGLNTQKQGVYIQVTFYKDTSECYLAITEIDMANTICHCLVGAANITLIKACLD